MITEVTFIDIIQVAATNDIMVREVTVIMDNDVEIARTYHRRSLLVDSNLDGEDPRVAAVATAAWTGAPPQEPFPPLPRRLVSNREFARLFTTPERIAIRTAAGQNAALADFYEMLQLGSEVDLDHPEVVAGLNAIANAGLLAAGRLNKILAGERPS